MPTATASEATSPATTVLELPSGGALTISGRMDSEALIGLFKATCMDRKGRLKRPTTEHMRRKLTTLDGCRRFVWELARPHNPVLTLPMMTALIREGEEVAVLNRVSKLVAIPDAPTV